MEKYKDRIYEHYVTYHNAHRGGSASLEKFRKRFYVNDSYYSGFLPTDKNARILDIGCGEGNMVFWLRSKGYVNVDGIDVSLEQIELGNSLGIKGLVHGDLMSFLRQSKAKYDFIIAKDVFEHFERQDFFECLKAIYEALEAGGKLLMQVPNGQGLFYTSIYFADVTHEMAYTNSSLRQLALSTGFVSVQCFPVNPLSRGIRGLVRSLLWNYKVLQLKFWKMIETGNPSGIFTSNLIALVEK